MGAISGADPAQNVDRLRTSAKREEIGGPGAEPPEKVLGPRPSDHWKMPCFRCLHDTPSYR